VKVSAVAVLFAQTRPTDKTDDLTLLDLLTSNNINARKV
jgi:hypothetical protein